jgi:hypothetical protein
MEFLGRQVALFDQGFEFIDSNPMLVNGHTRLEWPVTQLKTLAARVRTMTGKAHIRERGRSIPTAGSQGLEPVLVKSDNRSVVEYEVKVVGVNPRGFVERGGLVGEPMFARVVVGYQLSYARKGPPRSRAEELLGRGVRYVPTSKLFFWGRGRADHPLPVGGGRGFGFLNQSMSFVGNSLIGRSGWTLYRRPPPKGRSTRARGFMPRRSDSPPPAPPPSSPERAPPSIR